MDHSRKKLTVEDQGKIISKIIGFKDIHDKIVVLESKLKEMQEQKEMLLMDLDLARADEDMVMADLEFAYGPGKLDIQTLEWVSENETKIDENEFIERI